VTIPSDLPPKNWSNDCDSLRSVGLHLDCTPNLVHFLCKFDFLQVFFVGLQDLRQGDFQVLTLRWSPNFGQVVKSGFCS